MTLLAALVLSVVTVAIIAYPLFFSGLQRYLLRQEKTEFNEAESLLAGHIELEDDYQIGRLGKKDYQQQKILLQRRYLELRDAEDAASS